MAQTSDLKPAILTRVKAAGPQSVWTPRDFLDLAARDTVDKALQRLVEADQLRRIDRGLYDFPTSNRLTGQPSAPDPRCVIDAIARRDQIRVLVDGLTAANDLGLTNAVPAKIIVHADARLKTIRLGMLEILFKPTAASKLFWAGRPAMRLIQALHWMRDTDTIDRRVGLVDKIDDLLRHHRQGKAIRHDLIAGLPTLPSWMQDLLRPLLRHEAGDA